MTLQGKTLVLALLGAAGAGVVAGVTIEGWRKARGLPPIVAVDAGVSATADAGVSSRSDCAASIEHWNTVSVPGPIRYVYVDGGVRTEVQTVTVLVPDVRLSGTGSSSAMATSGSEAAASILVAAPKGEPERHWEAGPVALYGFNSQSVLWGAHVGWSGGPLGVRIQAMKGPGEFYAGGALVWRF